MFERTEEIINKGLEHENNLPAYTCAAYAIGCGDSVFCEKVIGNRSIEANTQADLDIMFDLASLTKLVAMTMVALKFIEQGRLLTSDTVGRYIPDAGVRADVTVRELMTHISGITPHIALEDKMTAADSTGVIKLILGSDPFCKPGEQVYYSCMGYMVLQRILEIIGGEPLDKLTDELVFRPLGMSHTCYNPRKRFPETDNYALTEYSTRRGGYINGEVHDENAHFLGGISGNAGVFSTLPDMVKFAVMTAGHGITADREMFLTPRMFEKAIHNYTPGLNEHRGLGFQLTSYLSTLTGDLFSEGSYGHTGFTGTSLYTDRETGLWGVLLTNAVHLGRENKARYFRIRRQFYTSAMAEYCNAKDKVGKEL